jgi:recombination protein RecA
MKAAFSKAEIESEIAARFGSVFQRQEKRPAEVISSGIPQIDGFTFGGLPRGAVTEVFGPASSGRTSFLLSSLAYATTHEEVCGLVDASNTFDPKSAAQAQINFERLLWIRCANNLEHAFKATDLLLQGGGFGLVVMDLGDVPAKNAKRIISSWWYRFRRTVETTPTALVVIAEESCVRSCATLALELKGDSYLWSSSESSSTTKSEILLDNTVVNSWPSSSPRPQLTSVAALKVEAIRRGLNRVQFPHANLLQGLHFQVECQRPLYLNKRNGEVLVCNANY